MQPSSTSGSVRFHILDNKQAGGDQTALTVRDDTDGKASVVGPGIPSGGGATRPGLVKKLAALTWNSGDAFVTVAASWGLRGALMAGFNMTAVALVNGIRKEHGLGPLKDDVAVNVAVQALLASVSSTAAASVLGSVHGMALNATHFLRAIVNWCVNGGSFPKEGSVDQHALNNITNPRLRLLCDDMVTAGFTLMVFSRSMRTALAGSQLPLNMQPGHVSADSAFNDNAMALGSAMVGGGAYLISSAVVWFKDGELTLGAPPTLTLRGAQERVNMRALAAKETFTAPLAGSRGHLSVPVFLGLAGGVSTLMSAHQRDIHPLVAGLINSSMAGLSFLTIANEWGKMKIRYELSPAAIAKSVEGAHESQRERWIERQTDHKQNQLERHQPQSVAQWFGDQVVLTLNGMASGGLVSAFVGSAGRLALGATVEDIQSEAGDVSSPKFALLASGVTFVSGCLLVKGMQALSPASTDDQARHRDQAWADGMMPSLVGGAGIGMVALAGGLPLATGVGLAMFNTLVTRTDPIGLAQKAYACLKGQG